MNNNNSNFSVTRILILTILLLLAFSAAKAGDDECQASGQYGFVCGPISAEDLVLVPGTKWIIAGGMAPGASITLIDSKQKSWVELYPADRPGAEQNMDTYGACPGSPDPNNFVSHGLNLRPGENGHSTLYIVGHGGREAIEVFDVDASGARPVLTWTGCVMMPEGMAANSVASFSDGSLVATVPLHPGKTISNAFAGELTGAVYQWSPGDSGFEMVQGTDLPYANGIEVSADEQEFYVASSVLLTVIAYSRSNPARQLRTTKPMAFIPDNLHMGSDGRLITAGLIVDDPVCGSVGGPEEFDLENFAGCPRPFIVKAIDPQTMQGKDLVRSPAIEQFSNITMGLQVGNDIWIGTFAGDRIAYRSLK
jgi:sugar lactone lactonase YvrE